MESFSSKILENAVNELSRLPGVGKRTALRLALHILKEEPQQVELFAKSLISLRNDIHYCVKCHNISDHEMCDICINPRRNQKIICVVEDIRDVIAIENTAQFSGVYHVLGGIISPIEGISPSDLTIQALIDRIEQEKPEEVIMALPATIEGDTTNFYIFRKIKDYPISVTTIARGIPVGDSLEYTDEVTLGRSILNRIEFGK